MKLSELTFDFTGFFKVSIENTTILCSGMSFTMIGGREHGYELYEWSMFDDNGKYKENIIVKFREADDKIIFGYKELGFIVTSFTNDRIELSNNFGSHYIQRVKINIA